ncbi:MAG: HAD hydrolase family protein, partial [Cutibacterium granulosum]|nr:HAD hydrolase family protein [Cutibacterium granulosum]
MLIATDLDGTLLTGDKQLSSRTRRMLAAAARAGV